MSVRELPVSQRHHLPHEPVETTACLADGPISAVGTGPEADVSAHDMARDHPYDAESRRAMTEEENDEECW